MTMPQNKSYEIFVYTGWRWAVVMMPMALAGVFLLFLLLPKDVSKWVFVLMSLIIWLLVDWLVTPLIRGKVFITLSDKGFCCVWTKRYFWSKLPDIILSWDRIVEYVFETSRSRDTFRLRLTNNEEFRLDRYTILLSPRDNFERFKYELPEFLCALELESGRKVARGKTTFQRIFSLGSRK